MRINTLLNSPYLPSIRTVGFSTQRFPDYVSDERTFHEHDVVEMFYVLSGRGRHLLAEEELELEPGDFGIVHFGQSHSIVSDEPMDIINIYINPARYALPPLSSPLSGVLPRILPLAPGLGHRLNRVQQYRLPADSRVGEILIALNDEAEQQRPGYLDSMRLYLRLVLIECARQALAEIGNEDTLVTGPQAAVERVRRQLDDAWKDTPDLDALAAGARMSKAHLCRIFRRHTGRTIVEYVHQRRIEQAMVLLDSTDQKIISIAHEAGFGDLAHFNRIFRRLAGMTPTQFRRRRSEPATEAPRPSGNGRD